MEQPKRDIDSAARPLRPTLKSLPADARAHNRSLVLRTLFHEGTASRAEIARITGLTRGTTSTLVTELIDDGLVEGYGRHHNQRAGKPSTPLGIRADAHQVVAVDLSDPEGVHTALLDLKGGIVRRHSCRFDVPDQLPLLIDLIDRMLAEATRPVLGIGVSCPGIISPGGVVTRSTTYEWQSLPLRDLIAEHVRLPVYVSNDANTAALAEFTFAGASGDGLVAITIGRGVGAGILLNGMLVHGSNYSTGEIGHLTAVEDGALCECGRRGCLQTVLSAPALRRAFSESKDVDEACAGIGRLAGVVLAPLVGALTLSQVRVSGQPDLLRPALLRTVAQTIQARVLPALLPDLSVSPASHGENTGLVGGAALVLSGELGIA